MDLTRIESGAWTGWWRGVDLSPRALRYVKYTIPSDYRVHTDGAWFIHQKYIEGVRFLADSVGSITVTDDPYVVMHLLPTASQAIIDAVFRTLAKELHPDAGGSPEAFIRLKTAYDKLKSAK